MGDFLIFYQNGGIFMHLITVTAGVALTCVLMHARARRAGADAPELLRVADRVAAIGVALGLTGMLFGVFDLCAAISMLDPEIDTNALIQAAARGCGIAPVTLAWSLMCAVPIWVATTIRGSRRAAAT